MNAINKILSIAVALSFGTFIPSQSASAAPLDQCEILKGKQYLIELEDGNYISFGVIDFFADLDKQGVAGTENLLWTYVGGGSLNGGFDTFKMISESLFLRMPMGQITIVSLRA